MTISEAVSHKQVFSVPVSIILLAFIEISIFVCAEQWHPHSNFEYFLNTKCTTERCLLRSNKYFT